MKFLSNFSLLEATELLKPGCFHRDPCWDPRGWTLGWCSRGRAELPWEDLHSTFCSHIPFPAPSQHPGTGQSQKRDLDPTRLSLVLPPRGSMDHLPPGVFSIPRGVLLPFVQVTLCRGNSFSGRGDFSLEFLQRRKRLLQRRKRLL